jgi:hypothetical protein
MAGPSIGTWVKVRSKSGGTTPRVLAKKFGGGAYQQGQVITQSEYESYKRQRADAKKGISDSSQFTKKISTIPIPAAMPRLKKDHESQIRELQSLSTSLRRRARADYALRRPTALLDQQRYITAAEEGIIRLFDRSKKAKERYSATFEVAKRSLIRANEELTKVGR